MLAHPPQVLAGDQRLPGMTAPEVRFVLALREDYWHTWAKQKTVRRRPAGAGTRHPAQTPIRLTPLDTDTAYLAIVEPAPACALPGGAIVGQMFYWAGP